MSNQTGAHDPSVADYGDTFPSELGGDARWNQNLAHSGEAV